MFFSETGLDAEATPEKLRTARGRCAGVLRRRPTAGWLENVVLPAKVRTRESAQLSDGKPDSSYPAAGSPARSAATVMVARMTLDRKVKLTSFTRSFVE